MYETPKIGVSIEVLLVNNETITGNRFITEDLASAQRNPLIEEFLNENDDRSNPATWLSILQMTGQSTNWFIQRWLRNHVYPISSTRMSISLPSTRTRRKSL